MLQFSTMVPPARYGGAERVVGRLTEELRAAGWRVHNAGLTSRAQARAGGDSRAIRNLYWPFDGRRRGTLQRTAWHAVDALLLSARRQVEALVDEVRPDVVVTHNLRGWGQAPWAVAGERGIPLVHVVHDYGLLCNASTLWRGTSCETICRPCRPRRDAAARRWPGGAVVGVSRAVLDEHGRHGVAFVAEGSVSHPTAAAAATGVPRRHADGVPRTLGFLGRVTEAKGIHLLIDAVAGTGQRLLVAGEGDPALVARLRERGGDAVEWLGYTDPAEVLDRVDVLVVPSVWKEPFGLVAVEAAQAGVPLLVSDRPGLVEAARSAGARFATFPGGDPDGLRSALLRSTVDYTAEPTVEDTVALVDVVARAAGRTGPQPDA